MSLSRAGFLCALVGVPFAAKAMERIIANGAPGPTITFPKAFAATWGFKMVSVNGVNHIVPLDS